MHCSSTFKHNKMPPIFNQDDKSLKLAVTQIVPTIAHFFMLFTGPMVLIIYMH